jgi:hypothetical protein
MKTTLHILLTIIVFSLAVITKSQTPSAPQALQATAITPTTFIANWVKVSDTLTYYIDVAADSNFSVITSGFENLYLGNCGSTQLSGFQPGTTYFYRVKASNGVEESGYSNTICLSTVYDVNVYPTATGNEVIVLFGDSAKFTVQSTDGTGFQWYKNDEIITESDNVNGVQTSTLTIRSAVVNDSGTYYCVVSVNKSEAQSKDVYLLVDVSLPVSLLNFKAVHAGNKIELEWSTVSEINNDHFTIERSDDGINYYLIAEVSGAGYSNEQLSYSFDDLVNPVENNFVYYKLKQTDFDGKTQTIGSAVCSNDNSSMFNENPVVYITSENTLYVSIASDKDQIVELEIYDLSGRMIKSNDVEIIKGNNIYCINTVDLNPGIYIVSLVSDINVWSEKIDLK